MRRTVQVAGWVCLVVLAVLSLLPAEEMVRTGFSGRAEHAVAYAGTGLLLAVSYARPIRIAAALVVYAAALELLQNVSPGRHPAVGDWVASSTGSLIGVMAACIAAALWPTVRALRAPL